MRAGFAQADITPKAPLSLSGFSARMNKPSEGVHDPLEVQALVLEEEGFRVLLLVFDLLGLGDEVTESLHRRLDEAPELGVARSSRLFSCTHTHSAPAAVKMFACGLMDEAYLASVVEAAVRAAREAAASLRPVRLRKALVPFQGASYYRRKVLADGTVSMAENPSGRVVRDGPTWDELLFFRIEDEAGLPLVGLVHWASHACTVCTPLVSGDHPALLRRRLADRFGLPFVFLQGACGDLNPSFGDKSFEQVERNVEAVLAALPAGDLPWGEPVEAAPFAAGTLTVRLPYQPLPSAAWAREAVDAFDTIAARGAGSERQMSLLRTILEVGPDWKPQAEALRFVAQTFADWSRSVLALYGEDGRGTPPDGCDLVVNVLRLGPILFCLIAAEVLVETAFALREALPDFLVVTLGYGSPIVGYLPTDLALAEGGYEPAQSFRYYARPAPFAKGTEPSVVRAITAFLGR